MTTVNGKSLAEALGAEYQDPWIHCVGWAETQHRECYNPIAKSNRATSREEWDRICTILDKPEEIQQALEEQASRLLCKRWHRDQYQKVVDQWYTKLQDYIQRQVQEEARARPTRRTAQQVFDTADSGYDSATSTLVNESDDSDVEVQITIAGLRPPPRPTVGILTIFGRDIQHDEEATPIARRPAPQASAMSRPATNNQTDSIATDRQSSLGTFAAFEAELATMSLGASDPDELMSDMTEIEEVTAQEDTAQHMTETEEVTAQEDTAQHLTETEEITAQEDTAQRMTESSSAAATILTSTSADFSGSIAPDVLTASSNEAKKTTQQSPGNLQKALFCYIMLCVLDVLMRIK